jgi:hypothetical protein
MNRNSETNSSMILTSRLQFRQRSDTTAIINLATPVMSLLEAKSRKLAAVPSQRDLSSTLGDCWCRLVHLILRILLPGLMWKQYRTTAFPA